MFPHLCNITMNRKRNPVVSCHVSLLFLHMTMNGDKQHSAEQLRTNVDVYAKPPLSYSLIIFRVSVPNFSVFTGCRILCDVCRFSLSFLFFFFKIHVDNYTWAVSFPTNNPVVNLSLFISKRGELRSLARPHTLQLSG